ncbi:MAG: hypothetical protein JO270_23575 [Acidobacteriaceae bacterium]|nr:hypothetical protein [Acidobacteriaceae bacterium]
MNEFISRYGAHLSGALSGFDRLVFRGQLPLIHDAGMKGYLWASKIAWKDYAAHVAEISKQVKQAGLDAVASCGRPVRYLTSARESKEQMARTIAIQDGISQGPICAFSAVEPGLTWRVAGDRKSMKLRLQKSMRPCLFVYQYWMDDRFGFMSTRLQTWFPFTLYVYINGREWLARQMDQAGVEYRRADNCFPFIADFARAQTLMDEQLTTDWTGALNACAVRIHPLFPTLFANYPVAYYWTAFQSEWAMDLVFGDPGQLRRLYPQLLHLGMLELSSPDVMRFMGKKVTRGGKAAGPSHEVITDMKTRAEGVRIKHRLGKNSIKLYDKAYTDCGAVLRPEVTINDPLPFRVFRHKAGESDDAPLQWRQMRAGIADLHRRAEVSQKALDRYCDALARVDDSTTLRELTQSIERRVCWNGQPVRALHPFDPADLQLLRAVNRGEFTINGIRNRDLQAILYSAPAEGPKQARQRSAAVSRKLRLLRAHGIIRKLSGTHRYQVTPRGRLILNAVLSAERTTTQQLTAMAA